MTKLSLLVPLASILALTGCSTSLIDTHVKEFDTINGMSRQVVEKLGSGNQGQFAVGAQGINPGIRVGAGVEYFAEARYVGLAGQLTASAQGTFNRELTPAEVADIQATLSAQYRSNAEKDAAVLKLLDRLGAKLEQKPAPATPADDGQLHQLN